MNISRIAGAAALGAAAILTLAGCIPLPSPQTTPSTTTPTTTEPGTTDPGTTSPAPSEPAADPGDALVDTQWTGTVEGPEIFIDLEFTFEADGTLYITTWSDETGVPFDSAQDTWSVQDGTLEMTLSQIEEINYIDLTAPFTGVTPSLAMTGVDGVGTAGYSVTFSQG